MRRVELFLAIKYFLEVWRVCCSRHSDAVVQMFIGQSVPIFVFYELHTGKRCFTQVCRAEHSFSLSKQLESHSDIFLWGLEAKYFQL